MTGRLIQLSGVIVDHIYMVDAVPAPGEEAVVYGATLAAGGGFNAMVAARRCGMDVVYAGTLGTGPFAEVAAVAMKTEGIAVLRPRLADRDQGCCTVLVDRAGERSFVAASDADGVLTRDDLDAIRWRAGDWALLSGYALTYRDSRAALTAWLDHAPKDLKLVFDPCPMVAGITGESRDAALRAALWITANRAEADVLTGQGDTERAVVALAGDRPAGGGAILRDGANGCYLGQPGGAVAHVPGHPVRALDTNGAGDAHTGAFIAMLAEGRDPLSAVRIANVCAALSTTKEGPSTAPTLNEVLTVMGATHDPAGNA